MNLIPLPYRIIGVVFVVLTLFSAGYYNGVQRAKEKAAAQQLVAKIKADELYRKEVERGNELSARLSAAESNIQIKIVERIKYVQSVTTGRDCLSAGAVSVLNGSGYPKLSNRAEPPFSAESASDTDVGAWAIDASGRYETCAERLNTLIDFVTAP